MGRWSPSVPPRKRSRPWRTGPRTSGMPRRPSKKSRPKPPRLLVFSGITKRRSVKLSPPSTPSRRVSLASRPATCSPRPWKVSLWRGSAPSRTSSAPARSRTTSVASQRSLPQQLPSKQLHTKKPDSDVRLFFNYQSNF